MEHINKAIFITNTFAQAHPAEHTALWRQFERDVPFSQRTGTFGADNVAYVKWLKQKDIAVFNEFVKANILNRTLEGK